MLSRAFASFGKHQSKHPLDLPVHASAALRRAFGSLVQHKSKSLLDLSTQASAAFRRRSLILQQVHQLHNRPVRPYSLPQEQQPLRTNSRGAPPACMLDPNDSVGGSFVQRFATLRSIGECSSDSELMLLLKKKTAPICYVWCDPYPWMHITQGISMTISVNKMVKAGCIVKILMADWFARTEPIIVSKTGGCLSETQAISSYNIEVWKAIGMDLDGVEFVRLSDIIRSNADEYWPLSMDIGRKSDLGRIKTWLHVHASKDTRGDCSIDPYMTRDFTAAEIFYPCLQCAAILLQQADIWLLDLDQRGAYILARQYRKPIESENRPIALFHNVLPNLLKYPGYESWDTRWAIFMEDDEDVIIKKIWNAFCPPKIADGNPCLEYIKHIVFPWFGKFEVVPNEDNGVNKTFLNMEELTADYESGALHPADLKQALVNAINMILKPVHDHFRSSAEGGEVIKAMKKFHNAC